MKKQQYIPHPADLSDIELPEELKPLIETIAKNIHEVWAQSRLAQEWTYGKERNDQLKTHPGLVPYEKLTETEKQYDRDTGITALKLIIKEGFKIIR